MQRSPNQAEAAAEATVTAMAAADPVLVGVARAGDVVPGMQRDMLLHAGPPLRDGVFVGPMLGALTGAMRYEGLARTDEEAGRLLAAGHVGLSPAHDHAAVGPMAGVVSWSMPVFVVRDAASGATAHVTINEGLGRTLRFGANGPDVLARLRWLADVAAPTLHAALELTGGLSLRALTIEALTRGDECHNRNKAATAQLCRLLAPAIVRANATPGRPPTSSTSWPATTTSSSTCRWRRARPPPWPPAQVPGQPDRHGHGRQRRRDGDPPRRHGRPVVHGPGATGRRGPLARRPRRRRRRRGHGRLLRDRGERARGLRPGRRAGHLHLHRRDGRRPAWPRPRRCTASR